MGKGNADFKRLYWLQRALLTMPENPPKDKKFNDCTPEEQASRYMHRAFEILSGDTFDRHVFADMMNPYKGEK